MSRPTSALRRLTICGLAIAVLAASWLGLSAPRANAQDGQAATLSLAVSPEASDQPVRTLGVAVDPGSSGLAALGASLTYDSTKVLITGCAVSEAGACNVDAATNTVLISVFNLTGIKTNEQLVTMSFETIEAASGMTEFALDVTTAVDFKAQPVAEIDVASLTLALADIDHGSVTGDVVADETAIGLFGLDVCLVMSQSESSTCTTTTGLGSWRIDDLPVGEYEIAVSDPNGVYENRSIATSVTADTVSIAPDVVLGFAGQEAVEPEVEPVTLPDAPATAAEIQPTGGIAIVYEASISGQVVALPSGKPVEAVQVCATQPLVLHQSCSTTDADGLFALPGLSAGNYWITTVDPLGQLQEREPTLIGVVGDQVTRSGVRIRMVSAAR